jgi:hypothetical protein
MNMTNQPDEASEIDPIDHEAATIDARSDDAPEQVAELVDHAEELGRDVEHSPVPPTDHPPTAETDDDPALTGEIDGD